MQITDAPPGTQKHVYAHNIYRGAEKGINGRNTRGFVEESGYVISGGIHIAKGIEAPGATAT